MTFEFRLPDLGEGVAEGEVVRWFVSVGATVREDDPLVSVLTDKANVEIPSPKSGRVLSLHARVGEKVKVGGLLVTIETEGATGPAPASPPPATAAKPLPPAPPSPPSLKGEGGDRARPSSAPVLASPFVRRRAAELGVNLTRVKGTGPGGRITDADLDTAKAGSSDATSSPMWPALSAPTGPAPTPSPVARAPTPVSDDVLERIPIRGIRRVIAEHMTESRHRAAHYTYVEEVDMSELVTLRDRMAKHVEKQGVRLSYLPFIVKAVVAGLKAYPKLNATVDDAREELLVRSSYHIGIATATPEGLIVPVVRNADRKSVVALAREIQDLGERGRAGTLTRAELMGSTFTITSLGALGGLLATPILNYPEVAILGVHKIQRRPVYRSDGSLGPADMMNLSISLDHRVVDGFEGAQFVAKVKSYLEDPHQLFAELA
ncbi:MAG TPA: dihydrolipoamide acetyltransferase family protein [Thermoplasmata archaeon]|jgi:pyruvate dehydrogenase E2 component (dihydrolipoamide acetyltransferase)